MNENEYSGPLSPLNQGFANANLFSDMFTRNWAEGEVGNIDTNDPAAQEAFRRKFRAGGVGNSVLRNWQGGADAQEGRNLKRELNKDLGRIFSGDFNQEQITGLLAKYPVEMVREAMDQVGGISGQLQPLRTNAIENGGAPATSPQQGGMQGGMQPPAETSGAPVSGPLSRQPDGLAMPPFSHPMGERQPPGRYEIPALDMNAPRTENLSGGEMQGYDVPQSPGFGGALRPGVFPSADGAPMMEEPAAAESQMPPPVQSPPQPEQQIGQSALAEGRQQEGTPLAWTSSLAGRKNADEYQRAEETRQQVELMRAGWDAIVGGAPDEDLRAMGLDNGQILKLRQEYNKSQGTWGEPQIVQGDDGRPVYKQFKTDNTGKIIDSRVVDGASPLPNGGDNSAGSVNGVVDSQEALRQQHLSGMSWFEESYLADTLKLPPASVRRIGDGARNVVEKPNATITQNNEAFVNLRNAADVLPQSGTTGYDRVIVQTAIARTAAVLFPNSQLPSFGNGGTKFIDDLKQSYGNLPERVFNALGSFLSGGHPDAGALRSALHKLADILHKESASVYESAHAKAIKYFNDNTPLLGKDGAEQLTNTILYAPETFGRQQGANDGRGLQGVQQEWQEIGDVDVANKDWKEWAGEALAEIPPDKRLDASYGFLYDRYWYNGVIEDINEETGVVSFRHKGDKKPFVWFAPNTDNPMQDAFYLKEPPAGVMTRKADVRENHHSSSPETRGALSVGGNAAPRYGKLVQWFLEDERNPAVAGPPLRPRSSQETQSIGGAALSGRFLR